MKNPLFIKNLFNGIILLITAFILAYPIIELMIYKKDPGYCFFIIFIILIITAPIKKFPRENNIKQNIIFSTVMLLSIIVIAGTLASICWATYRICILPSPKNIYIILSVLLILSIIIIYIQYLISNEDRLRMKSRIKKRAKSRNNQ